MINAFVDEFAKQNNKRITGLSADAQAALQRYDWPGNIRELRAAIEHAVALSRGERLGVRDLPGRVAGTSGLTIRPAPGASASLTPDLNLAVMEKSFIQQALNTTDWNITEAAKLLGISRRTLHRKLNSFQIKPS